MKIEINGLVKSNRIGPTAVTMTIEVSTETNPETLAITCGETTLYVVKATMAKVLQALS